MLRDSPWNSSGRAAEWLDVHAFIFAKGEMTDAAIGRDVLVLLADGLAADIDFDFASFAGELLGGGQLAFVGVQSVQQPHGHSAGGAQAGTFGWHIGQRGDFDAVLHAGAQQGLAHQLVLQVAHVLYGFFLGVIDDDQLVEARHDHHVHILVDGGTDHGAFVFAVVAVEIRAAAGKTDAQGGL